MSEAKQLKQRTKRGSSRIRRLGRFVIAAATEPSVTPSETTKLVRRVRLTS